MAWSSRRQAFTWANVNPVQWRHMASSDHDELMPRTYIWLWDFLCNYETYFEDWFWAPSLNFHDHKSILIGIIMAIVVRETCILLHDLMLTKLHENIWLQYAQWVKICICLLRRGGIIVFRVFFMPHGPTPISILFEATSVIYSVFMLWKQTWSFIQSCII